MDELSIRVVAPITGFRNEKKEAVTEVTEDCILLAASGNNYINCTFDQATDDEGVLLADLPIVQWYGTPEQLKKIVVGRKMSFKA
jgi:hypothetical protein